MLCIISSRYPDELPALVIEAGSKEEAAKPVLLFSLSYGRAVKF